MEDTLQDSGLAELLNRPAIGQRLALSVSSDYLGLYEMKSLLQSKGKPSAEQSRQPAEWETLHQWGFKKLVCQGNKTASQQMGWWRYRQFSRKETQMANDFYKMCSISLAIREMQIKTILRYCITPVRMALINKFDNKCWRQYGDRELLFITGRRGVSYYSHMEVCSEVPANLKDRAPTWPICTSWAYIHITLYSVTEMFAYLCLLLPYSL